MNILITGSSGQLGQCLSQVLEGSGFNCFFLSRNELDVCDPNAINTRVDEIQPHLILNTAAYTAVDQAESDGEIAMQTNAISIYALAQAANRVGSVVIHFSTDYVFDGAGVMPLKENHISAPLNVYGDSKWRGEEILKVHAKKFIILRSSWLFSEYGNNFVTKIIERAKVQSVLSVISDEVGAPTYAMDLAEAVKQLLTQYNQRGDLEWGIYHYCGSPAVNRYEFAVEILGAAVKFGIISTENVQLKKITSEELQKSGVKRPLNVVLECDKIKRVFGIEQPDWRDGLIKSIQVLAKEAGNDL